MLISFIKLKAFVRKTDEHYSNNQNNNKKN